MPPVCWCTAALLTLTLMEGWASLLHRCIWHGALWPLHRSHHRRGTGGWQANDLLSLMHLPVALGLILYGCLGTPGIARELAFGAGLGMSTFGLAYLMVHDGIIHGRLPIGGLRRWAYVRAICAAHERHHRTGGAPFGLFSGPWQGRPKL